MAKGKELAERKSSVPANWKTRLAAEAKQESERTASGGGGNTISIGKSGEFTNAGSDIGAEIDVIVLDHVILRKWFDRPFNKDNPTPPACFALKADPKNIAPHADSPNKQCEICDECELNQWGTARDGESRGKACPERERLALLHVDDIKRLENLEDAEIMLLEVPTTSIGTFRKYVKRVTGASELPLWATVTKLIVDDKSDYQKLKSPEFVSEVPGDMLDALDKLRRQARELLMAPFDVSGYTAPTKGKKAANGGAKRSRLS